MNSIFTALARSPEYSALAKALGRQETPAVAAGLSGVHKCAAIAALCRETKRRALILAANEAESQRFQEDLTALGLRPLLRLGMALGEGTGAVTVMPLIDMALRIYFDMPSFDDMGIEAYRPL